MSKNVLQKTTPDRLDHSAFDAKKLIQKLVPYVFISTTIIALIVFMYLSVGVAFFTAMTDKVANPLKETHWIWFDNFLEMLSDEIFWYSFRNQFLITLCAVFNSTFFPMLAAILLFFVRHQKVSRAIKTAFVLPMLVPSIVTVLIWKYLYSPRYGFNSVLELFSLESLQHNWLNEKGVAIWAIIMMGFPFVSGLYFLLFHTGINNIDGSIYDAAKVDGANSWHIVRYVQLPEIWPYVKVVVTLSLISSLSGYGQVSALTNGGPGYDTMIPALYMYKVAFGDGRHGYGSAMGVVLFVVILLLTLITNKLISRKGED